MVYYVEAKKHIVRSLKLILDHIEYGKHENIKLAIYPFGTEGMMTKAILNKFYDISEDLIVDNYLSYMYESIKSIEDLKKYDLSDYVFLIASDRADIHDELREKIYGVVEEEKCFEVIPNPVFYDVMQSPYSEKMNLREYMFREAAIDTARYMNENMVSVPVFNSRYALLEHCLIEEADDKGLFMEFGVYKGRSINFIASIMMFNTIYGFDSFEGLPKAWIPGLGKGAFSCLGKMPKVKKNVKLYKGWFDEQLPMFICDHKNETCSFIHIDCDIYESAKTCLQTLGEMITTGTVIVFDEYFNRPGWRENEFKAWQEFVKEHNITYKYVGYVSENYDSCQVAVKVI